jgi:hypothetical protein
MPVSNGGFILGTWVDTVEKKIPEVSTGSQALRGSCSNILDIGHVDILGDSHPAGNTLCGVKELHDSQIYYLHPPSSSTSQSVTLLAVYICSRDTMKFVFHTVHKQGGPFYTAHTGVKSVFRGL